MSPIELGPLIALLPLCREQLLLLALPSPSLRFHLSHLLVEQRAPLRNLGGRSRLELKALRLLAHLRLPHVTIVTGSQLAPPLLFGHLSLGSVRVGGVAVVFGQGSKGGRPWGKGGGGMQRVGA